MLEFRAGWSELAIAVASLLRCDGQFQMAKFHDHPLAWTGVAPYLGLRSVGGVLEQEAAATLERLVLLQADDGQVAGSGSNSFSYTEVQIAYYFGCNFSNVDERAGIHDQLYPLTSCCESRAESLGFQCRHDSVERLGLIRGTPTPPCCPARQHYKTDGACRG